MLSRHRMIRLLPSSVPPIPFMGGRRAGGSSALNHLANLRRFLRRDDVARRLPFALVLADQSLRDRTPALMRRDRAASCCLANVRNVWKPRALLHQLVVGEAE